MQAQVSPYAGQQTRAIKALSAEEVDDLLNANGMALAKAAELNGYPGPLHTLEMADKLGLTADQVRAIKKLRAHEQAAGKPLGAQIVALERDLDQRFVKREIDKKTIPTLIAKIDALQARLRAMHLATHLDTAAILTASQIARYNEMRGYTGSGGATEHDPSKQHTH